MSGSVELSIVLSMLGIFSLSGTIGNALVLYIYLKKKDITTSSLFILTLAATDMFTCLVIIPYNIIVLNVDYQLEYEFACKLYMFLITCNVPFSAFIMVAIAFDRYFCICHPFLHAITIPRAKVIAFTMGLFACFLGIITSMCYGIVPYDEDYSNINSTLNGISNASINIIASVNNTIIHTKQMASDNKSEGNVFAGMCFPSNDVFDISFTKVYQKIYAGFYLLSFLIVFVLYGLIYHSIHVRRAQKAKRKRTSLYPSSPTEYSAAETQLTILNGTDTDCKECEPEQKKFRKRTIGLKEKVLCANIRTAAMLFIVTVVFLFAFLPAWLMAHDLLTYNMVVFYMYFIYNVGNPVIYAFMNNSFRDDVRMLFKRIFKRK